MELYMTHKALLTATIAVFVGTSVQFASAFPAAQWSTLSQPAVEKVTFWGRSFPYHYSWSLAEACTRYETVETPRGPVTKRVWVCSVNGPRDAVVSYRN